MQTRYRFGWLASGLSTASVRSETRRCGRRPCQTRLLALYVVGGFCEQPGSPRTAPGIEFRGRLFRRVLSGHGADRTRTDVPGGAPRPVALNRAFGIEASSPEA